MERLYWVFYASVLTVFMQLLLAAARLCDRISDKLWTRGISPGRPVWFFWKLGHKLAGASLRLLKHRISIRPQMHGPG